MHMQQYHIIALGGFAVINANGAPVSLSTRKQGALLAFLAMQPKQICRRERLAAIFWRDKDETHARHSLSQALYELKRQLGQHVIRSSGQLVWLMQDTVTIDAAEVLSLTEQRSRDAPLDAGCLYQGELLSVMEPDRQVFDHRLAT